MITTPGATMRAVLLTAVADDETFSAPFKVAGYTHIVFYIICNGTVSSGAVTYQEAPEDPATHLPFSGTWAAIGSAVSPTSSAGISATHLTVGAYDYVRARVSTAIGGGGTITLVMVAS